MIKLIENNADLEEFCHSLSQEPFITVDLEFLREKTYYAKLCLIQVGSKKECAIIDPLAPGLNLSPFFELMDNPNIIKVFHAGRQDIEIIYFMHHKIPHPLFDTQVAAQVCGYGESVGYETLVNGLLNLELDKSCRFTNWEARPLDERQLEYALSDVTHLVDIYLKLQDKLRQTGREDWLKEEIEHLSQPSTYEVNPLDAWQKIKHRSHNAKFLTILRELTAWRERRAQKHDVNRRSIIQDECLLNIAAVCPSSQEQLRQIRGMRKDVADGKLGKEIIEVLEQAKQIPAEQYLKPKKEEKLPANAGALWEILRLLLKIKSAEHGVAPKLIASDDDLLHLLKHKDNPLLKGWRYEIFGRDAIGFCEGKLSISFNKAKRSIDILPIQNKNPE